MRPIAMQWSIAILLVTSAFGCAPPPNKSPSAQDRSFIFTAVGDIGDSADAAATLDLIVSSKADFHLALGDLSYSTAPETAWCDFVKSHVGEEFPFQLLVGNHEDDYGKQGHIRRFAECLPDRIGVTGKYPEQYYFDYRTLVRFIVISPDLTVDGRHYYYGDENPDYNWLAGAIDGARSAGFPWVVVAMHKSCLSIGEYYCNIYSDLLNLLVARRVDLILQAHEHSYQRTKQLTLNSLCKAIPIDSFDLNCVSDSGTADVYVKGAGTIQVIAGTGGEELYAINTADAEADYFARWMDPKTQGRKGLVKFEVSPDRISAAFVGSTFTSNFSDNFTISAAGR